MKCMICNVKEADDPRALCVTCHRKRLNTPKDQRPPLPYTLEEFKKRRGVTRTKKKVIKVRDDELYC